MQSVQLRFGHPGAERSRLGITSGEVLRNCTRQLPLCVPSERDPDTGPGSS